MQKFGIIKNAVDQGQLDSWKDIYKKGHKEKMIKDIFLKHVTLFMNKTFYANTLMSTNQILL